MNDMGWTKEQANTEKANEMACIQAAKDMGYTEERANCDMGILNCFTCPWKTVEKSISSD